MLNDVGSSGRGFRKGKESMLFVNVARGLVAGKVTFVMEVTKANFQEAQEALAAAVERCDFIAVDGEFTGLDDGHPIGAYDTPEDRYHKIRKGGVEFLMLQVGICTFQYDNVKQRYVTRPFNFHVFPRPSFKQAPDVRFLCQSSSIDFLISHNFDFNKAFKEGIPYLSPAQEQALRDNLEFRHKMTAQFSSPAFTTPDGHDTLAKGPITVPEEHQPFIDNTCSDITKFLEETEDDVLELPPCSGYHRKLIYQVIKSKFKSSIHIETKTREDKMRYILITRIKGEDDIKKMEAAKQATELAELEQAVGFSKAMRIVSQSGKLVVGHNMMLDLAHLLHQFYSPLPQDYSEFKSLTRSVFPKLLDTKLMASTHPFKEKFISTVLGDLHKALESSPFTKPEIELAEGFDKYETGEQLHEAGYDAYITGLCFISMSNFLGTFQDPPKARVSPTSPLIEPFINKLYLMRVSDIPYLNLAGPDLQPNRESVFYVTFPKEWKTTDLLQLFSPFGNIQVSWINETSAFVCLMKKLPPESVLEQLGHGDSHSIVPYNTYRRGQANGDGHGRKRAVPAVDIAIPAKKRKSLGSDLSPYSSRSITPIPEEEEDCSNQGEGPGNKEEGPGNKEEPVKMEEGDTGGVSAAKKPKLFQEPDSW